MERLAGLRRADAAIVGGGLTGLLLGASLADAGMSVVILETSPGASQACAGIATLLCAPLFQRIEASRGAEAAASYAEALSVQLRTLASSGISYIRETSVYAYARTEDDLPMLENQHTLLNRLGIPARYAPDAGGCPFPVERSLLLDQQVILDIPRWMAALRGSIRRSGGRIYPDSQVIALEDTRVFTAHGSLEAPRLILACGKPLGLRSKPLLALMESRRILRCELSGGYPLHACQMSADGRFTLCPAALGAILTVDGGRVGTGGTCKTLQRFLSANLPDWQQEAFTFSQEIYPTDGLPLIGSLPGSRALFACGYSRQGILGAMHAAQVLTRRILGRNVPEDSLYSPYRTLSRHATFPALRRLRRLYAANCLRRSAPACPHCRCRLRYFAPARHWECAACGSSYSMLGHVITGPGMQSARVSARQRPDI